MRQKIDSRHLEFFPWLTLPELNPGWHTLRLIAVDAGVVVDQIVLDFGGLHPSYNGPAETRVP